MGVITVPIVSTARTVSIATTVLGVSIVRIATGVSIVPIALGCPVKPVGWMVRLLSIDLGMPIIASAYIAV